MRFSIVELKRLEVAVVGIGLICATGCRNGGPRDRGGSQRVEQSPAQTTPDEKADLPSDPPDAEPIVLDEPNDLTRWVFAEEIVDGTDGGWATGTFNAERNRIEVDTENLRQFALHTDRIPINWERLVVISIDGSNAELRRRDQDVLHFRRERGGRWVVIEPTE